MPDHTLEMENVRTWWAEMPDDQRRAVLMRRDPGNCPCGAGLANGHTCGWCMPHSAWLPQETAEGGTVDEHGRVTK